LDEGLRVMPSKKDLLEDTRAKFLLAGFLNTVAGFVIFTVLYMVLKDQISYMVILLISQVFAVMFSHSTQRILVWKSTRPYTFELVRFSGSYAAIGLVNLVLLRIAVEAMMYPVLISQFAIGIILTLISYVVQKKLIFK
jgi:putative flippase GtrA